MNLSRCHRSREEPAVHIKGSSPAPRGAGPVSQPSAGGQHTPWRGRGRGTLSSGPARGRRRSKPRTLTAPACSRAMGWGPDAVSTLPMYHSSAPGRATHLPGSGKEASRSLEGLKSWPDRQGNYVLSRQTILSVLADCCAGGGRRAVGAGTPPAQKDATLLRTGQRGPVRTAERHRGQRTELGGAARLGSCAVCCGPVGSRTPLFLGGPQRHSTSLAVPTRQPVPAGCPAAEVTARGRSTDRPAKRPGWRRPRVCLCVTPRRLCGTPHRRLRARLPGARLPSARRTHFESFQFGRSDRNAADSSGREHPAPETLARVAPRGPLTGAVSAVRS